MAVRMMLEAIDAHRAEAIAPESTAESRALRRIRLGPLLELEDPLARTLGMSADGRGLSALSSPSSTVSTESMASVQSSVCSTSSLSATSTVARIVPHRFKRASALLRSPIDELVGVELDLVKHQSERGTIIGNFADTIAEYGGVAAARLSVHRLRDDFERLDLSAPIDASTLQFVVARAAVANAPSYLNHLDRIGKSDYVVTDDDLLRCRLETVRQQRDRSADRAGRRRDARHQDRALPPAPRRRLRRRRLEAGLDRSFLRRCGRLLRYRRLGLGGASVARLNDADSQTLGTALDQFRSSVCALGTPALTRTGSARTACSPARSCSF